MKVFTSTYTIARGTWSEPLPDLDSESTLVLIFGAPGLRETPDVLFELRRRYPRSLLVGCSTAGEISEGEVRDGTLSVSISRFEATRLELATLEVADPAESFSAGSLLARKLARPDLRAVFVLSEGLQVNGSELVRGLNSQLPKEVVTTGGLAGDGTAFGKTWVFDGQRMRERLVVAIGLSGDALTVSHGSQGGWQTKGREHEVTLSKGNVVLELDGRPALEVYEEYLGDKRRDLPASGLLFPLSMRAADDPKRLTRTLLAIDREKRSLTFAGDVPMFARVSVMEADFDRLVAGARDASRFATTLPVSSDADSLTIAISCVGRRLLLKDRSREEVIAVRKHLPARGRVVGFYSYGEISPSGVGACDLHNQTMTLTMFSEDPRKLAMLARATSSAPPPRPSLPPDSIRMPRATVPPVGRASTAAPPIATPRTGTVQAGAVSAFAYASSPSSNPPPPAYPGGAATMTDMRRSEPWTTMLVALAVLTLLVVYLLSSLR